MKSFLCIILFSLYFCTYANDNNNETLRNLFHSIEGESDLEKILKKQEQMEDTIAESYFRSAMVMQAQSSFSPLKKHQYFIKGSKMIEKSIVKRKTVENIYLRLLIKLNSPNFLGYYKNIESDLLFIEKNIDSCNLSSKWKITFLEKLTMFESHEYDFDPLKSKLSKFKTT